MQITHFDRGKSLAEHTSIGLGGKADYFADILNETDLYNCIHLCKKKQIPFLALGGGSNIVFSDSGYNGLIGRIKCSNVTVKTKALNKSLFRLTVPAQVELDLFVSWAVDHGFAGLTCLSGIPGTVGAAPVQNVGAYGTEIGEFIESIEVFDLEDGRFYSLTSSQCSFQYRHSLFKAKPHILIWRVTFLLRKEEQETLSHKQLEEQLQHKPPTLRNLREAVLDIRGKKGMLASSHKSCGSFFKNPVITEPDFLRLKDQLGHQIPSYTLGENALKIPAAWLIEQAGFKKGSHQKGVGISPDHSLALINVGNGTSSELLKLASEISHRINDRFCILLEPEPLILDEQGQKLDLQGAIQ